MRIGISTIHVVPGKSGSHEPYMVNLIRALAHLPTSHHFTLFVTRENQRLFEAAREKMDFVVYPEIARNGLPRIFLEQIKLPLDASIKKLDVLHYAGNASSIFVRKSDVVTIHFDPFTQKMSISPLHILYYNAVFRINKRAGKLIVPSQVYANQLLELFSFEPDRMSAVHHGVDSAFRHVTETDRLNSKQRYAIEDDAILTVTNTLPHKNIPNLLMAFEILLTQYGRDNQLVMVGNIDNELLDDLINRIASNPKKMRAGIIIIPFLPHRMLPSIYTAASLFVFYSLVETFGMPLVEAMACGTPVIASDIPVHKEILNDGGELIPPDQPALLAAKINTILTDKKLQEQMKANALLRSQQFSWEKAARQTLQAYEAAYSSQLHRGTKR